MFKRIAGLASKIGATRILIGIAIGAAGWAGWATWQMQSLQQQVGACDQIRQTAEDNAGAVVALSERLSMEVNQRALDQRQQARAQSQWEQQREQLREQSAARQQARERIYATDDNCQAWRTGLVCVAIDDSMRDSRTEAAAVGRSSGASADQDSG